MGRNCREVKKLRKFDCMLPEVVRGTEHTGTKSEPFDGCVAPKSRQSVQWRVGLDPGMVPSMPGHSTACCQPIRRFPGGAQYHPPKRLTHHGARLAPCHGRPTGQAPEARPSPAMTRGGVNAPDGRVGFRAPGIRSRRPAATWRPRLPAVPASRDTLPYCAARATGSAPASPGPRHAAVAASWE
jgi:hypothetical protein